MSRIRIPAGLRIARALALTALWCGLWGRFDVATILVGLALSIALLVAIPLAPIDPRTDRHVSIIGVLRLAVWFLPSLVSATLSVVGAIFTSSRQAPGCIKFHLGHYSTTTVTSIANILSLTPGTLTTHIFAVDRGWDLVVHALDATSYDDVKAFVVATERRVVAAWGTQAERDALAMEGTA